MMTPDEVAAAKALARAATGEGEFEWWVNENDGGICAGPVVGAAEVGYTDMNENDSALVLAAPVLVLRLAVECERLNAEVVRLGTRAAYLRCCALSGERPTEEGDRMADEHALRLIGGKP
jgi:hypothetical protein